MRNHFCDLINGDDGLSVEKEAKDVLYRNCYKKCLIYVMQNQVFLVHNAIYDVTDNVCEV